MSGAAESAEALISRMLRETRTIAVVGASPDPFRASHYVMAYLQARGYRTLPVNPRAAGTTINGERVYASLDELPGPVEMVDVFRNSAAAAETVDEAIAQKERLGIRFVWLQLGVINPSALRRAEAAGLRAVQDKCIKVEYARLFGSAPRGSLPEIDALA